MTINEIINLDPAKLNTMTASEMKPLIQTMNSAVNKRVKRLQKSGVFSPALEGLKNTGRTSLLTNNKNINQLRSEFTKGRNFLSSPTASVSGAKKSLKKTAKTIEEETGVDITKYKTRTLNKIFGAMDKAYENIRGLYQGKNSASKAFEIYNNLKDKRISQDDLAKLIEQQAIADYEQDKLTYNEAFEDPFEIDFEDDE